MNKREAYKLGYEEGLQIGDLGDFTEAELADEDKFLGACHEISENSRQFEGHPTYHIEGRWNSNSLFEAFEEGEFAGWKEAYKKVNRQVAVARSKQ